MLLGSVTVRVDTTSCAVVTSSFGHSDANLYIPPLQSARRAWRAADLIRADVKVLSELCALRFPSVEACEQRARSAYRRGYRMRSAESATGALQTTGSSIQGKVSEPWVLDLVPVVGLIVSIDTGEARAKLSMQFQPLTDDLPGLVN
jgi:hypothetical protein